MTQERVEEATRSFLAGHPDFDDELEVLLKSPARSTSFASLRSAHYPGLSRLAPLTDRLAPLVNRALARSARENLAQNGSQPSLLTGRFRSPLAFRGLPPVALAARARSPARAAWNVKLPVDQTTLLAD